MALNGKCPICDVLIVLEREVDEHKVINCPNCQSILVDWAAQNNWDVLEEGPQIGEDWECN